MFKVNHCPTGAFTIVELQEQEIGEFYVVQEQCAKYVRAQKL